MIAPSDFLLLFICMQAELEPDPASHQKRWLVSAAHWTDAAAPIVQDESPGVEQGTLQKGELFPPNH